ncbi:hypothetical protein Desor_2638 [Desulfosporosinus orientis DSM 765]|uniref:Uncharacterized protein n=1 Tax=Desulfosporosinus orientis (strain ATCC 19365 / DSM 765 / NCIMB 8382 / VKM B-1628 / Singapore I) TaxID=768706 RepID=G7W8X7_DESOD|nr:hypothetical protein Desor_2638 [Desulfosporosinus orientis DSM 765]
MLPYRIGIRYPVVGNLAFSRMKAGVGKCLQ